MGPGNEAVYVVDDDRTVREALSALLQANGKEVRMFNSETEFLSIERKDGAACLILDLKMPGIRSPEVRIGKSVDSYYLYYRKWRHLFHRKSHAVLSTSSRSLLMNLCFCPRSSMPWKETALPGVKPLSTRTCSPATVRLRLANRKYCHFS